VEVMENPSESGNSPDLSDLLNDLNLD
jgi:hypothetical protein